MKHIYSAKSAAVILNISYRRMRQWIQDLELRPDSLRPTQRFIFGADVLEILRQHQKKLHSPKGDSCEH